MARMVQIMIGVMMILTILSGQIFVEQIMHGTANVSSISV